MDQVTATFRNSVPKTLGLLAGGILLTISSLMIVLQVIPNAGIKALIAGYVGLPFFGGASILMVARLFQAGPVIEVGTSGIRYRRWPQDFFVPWSAVSDMSIQQQRRRKFLILRLRPQEASGNAASRSISMVGLDGSFDDGHHLTPAIAFDHGEHRIGLVRQSGVSNHPDRFGDDLADTLADSEWRDRERDQY